MKIYTFLLSREIALTPNKTFILMLFSDSKLNRIMAISTRKRSSGRQKRNGKNDLMQRWERRGCKGQGVRYMAIRRGGLRSAVDRRYPEGRKVSR